MCCSAADTTFYPWKCLNILYIIIIIISGGGGGGGCVYVSVCARVSVCETASQSKGTWWHWPQYM